MSAPERPPWWDREPNPEWMVALIMLVIVVVMLVVGIRVLIGWML